MKLRCSCKTFSNMLDTNTIRKNSTRFNINHCPFWKTNKINKKFCSKSSKKHLGISVRYIVRNFVEKFQKFYGELLNFPTKFSKAERGRSKSIAKNILRYSWSNKYEEWDRFIFFLNIKLFIKIIIRRKFGVFVEPKWILDENKIIHKIFFREDQESIAKSLSQSVEKFLSIFFETLNSLSDSSGNYSLMLFKIKNIRKTLWWISGKFFGKILRWRPRTK